MTLTLEEAKLLAQEAVHQYDQMQRELYSKHHAFAGPDLDKLAKTMQDVYGAPIQQEVIAVERALNRNPKSPTTLAMKETK